MHNNVFNLHIRRFSTYFVFFYSDVGPSALRIRMEESAVIVAAYDVLYGEDMRECPIKKYPLVSSVSHNGVLLCCWMFEWFRFVSKGQWISFHCFPTDYSLLIEWLAKMSRADLDVTKDTRLCSDHFEPDYFQRDRIAELLGWKGKRNLKPGAVPPIFDHRTRRSLDYQLKSVFKNKGKKR